MTELRLSRQDGKQLALSSFYPYFWFSFDFIEIQSCSLVDFFLSKSTISCQSLCSFICIFSFHFEKIPFSSILAWQWQCCGNPFDRHAICQNFPIAHANKNKRVKTVEQQQQQTNQIEMVGKPFQFHNLSTQQRRFDWNTKAALVSLTLMQLFCITISTKLIKITCQWIHPSIRDMPQTTNAK